VECRILKLLHQSELVDIRKFNFHMDLRKDLGLDSLNITALLTEIEQEFTIVFEDRVFEGVKYLEDLVKLICRDEKAF
jgi:acyl carrier protein